MALVVRETRNVYKGSINRLEPLGESLKIPVRIMNATKAKLGHFVLAKINKIQNRIAYATVVKDLGSNDNPAARVKAFVTQAGIPTTFPEEVCNESTTLPDVVRESDLKNRLDLRDKLIVTIDGAKSRDFDDAVNVEMCLNGNYKLGVHIADVSHYVTQDSPLDREAFKRGTSVYLPGYVIPMLPEKLSNGICSLNPNVDRLAISCIMEITPQGKTLTSQIVQSVIKSHHRLTYPQVNDFLNKKTTFTSTALKRQIKQLHKLAQILKDYKKGCGYIGFDLAETIVALNPTGEVSQLKTKRSGEAEVIIEQLMIRTNEVVAEKISDKHLPFLYRVHERPTKEKLDRLHDILSLFEISLPTDKLNTSRGFAKFVNRLKLIRFDPLIQITLLRTLSKAVYAPKNIGHFGLGSSTYTHFTSPIRRYPDLLVHRMIREYLLTNPKDKVEGFASLLPGAAESSSAAEVRAQDLERRVLQLKEAEYYQKFVGKELKGVITGMKRFGFFVELPDQVSGLVHKRTLTDNTYSLSKDELQLVSNTRKYKLGDEVQVVIVGGGSPPSTN